MRECTRLGLVNYINALPFYFPFEQGVPPPSGISFSYDYPSRLNAMLQKEEVDIALTSSVEYLNQGYEMLPGFGISACEKILSVNFYVKRSLEALNGGRIGLTHQSATSSMLLKVLCHHVWKISPQFEQLDTALPFDAYDGILLIGDDALLNTTIPGFQVMDLATVWYEQTQLPFVFALFSIRSAIAPSILQSLAESLSSALAWSEKHPDLLVEAAAKKKSGIPLSIIRNYFQACLYRLGYKEQESLNLFNQMQQDVKN